jgi:C-terminal processing protease CtpA/Prc
MKYRENTIKLILLDGDPNKKAVRYEPKSTGNKGGASAIPPSAEASAEADPKSGRIGITLSDNVIETVEPDSPASAAQLAAGDSIIEIDGEKVGHLSQDRLISLITGGPGSNVTLKVQRTTVVEIQRM